MATKATIGPAPQQSFVSSLLSGVSNLAKPLTNALFPQQNKAVLGAASFKPAPMQTSQNPIGPVKPAGYQPPAPTPTTGGQPAAPTSQVNLTPPDFSNTGPSTDDLGILQGQYHQAANDISAQGPQLDQSYNLAKGDISNALGDAQLTADKQKANVNTQFGDTLRNTIKTYQDLGKQRNGTFSALNALDSSAYADEQQKADQSLVEQQGINSREQNSALSNIDQQFSSYQKSAQSQLGQLALQYQQGKNAISSALANNDLQQASAISQALQQIRGNAQAIQNNMVNFANQAASLKAQGNNVSLGIQGVNGNQYQQQMAQFLQQLQGNSANKYSIPTATMAGQGYIGDSTDPNKKLQLGTGVL